MRHYRRENMYYTYMLRCEDNSVYTGITTSIERRMSEHFSGGKMCAKYTLRHTPIKLEAVWRSENKSLASKLEYAIKTLKKVEKEELIKNNRKFKQFLSERLDCSEYKREKGVTNGKYTKFFN